MTEPVALLVDDVPDLLAVMAEVLDLALPDHTILTAASGRQADAVLAAMSERNQHLSVLIADQSLGDRTGLELLSAVPADSQACLILISGRASEAIGKKAEALGAAVLWKPFRMQALVKKVNTALGR